MENKMIFRSFSLLVLLGVIWGSGYSIARYAMTHGVDPLGYSFWQSLGPAIVLLLLTLNRWRHDARKLLKFWPYFFVTGLVGIAIPNTNMYFSAPHLPAGMVAVIVNIVPLLVYPLALLFHQEKFHPGRMLGILIGVMGIMILVWPTNSLSVNSWVWMTLLTPLCFAACVIYAARCRPPHIDSLVLSAGMLCISALVLIPVVLWNKGFYMFHYPFQTADWVIILEIILSSIGYILFFKLIKIAGPVYYSLVSAVVSLTGLFWGCVVFHETISFSMIIAVICILAAIFLVTFYQQSKKRVSL
jgi:drug/metabolite transporter (DMT)-like permease